MVSHWLEPKYLVLYVFVLSALYVHFRGRVRFAFLRQLFNHSTVLAPYNVLMYLFSAVPKKPILDLRQFPELATLRDNWEIIRDEALKLYDDGYIRAAARNDDAGFNSFFKRGWKRFYLKWYYAGLPSAKALCPNTVALLESIPSLRGGMFALLPPGGCLNPHRDPFAGSLRYHLGLATPNSEACHIFVDGTFYHWRNGEDILFDETYIHSAENRTDVTRLILLCDVERPLRTKIMAALNRFVCRRFMRATASPNTEVDSTGLLNAFFSKVYHPIAERLDAAGKRLKAWNRTVYYLVKYSLILGVLYAIFV